MREVVKMMEKKILPAFMVAVVECQGGRAFADEFPPPSVQAEDIDQRELLYKEFGQGYRLFEQTIEGTTEEELIEAGLTGDPTVLRGDLKKTLRLMWRSSGRKDWKDGERTYAAVRYDILAHGGKLFLEIERQEQMIGFESNDDDRFMTELADRIQHLTGIPMEHVAERQNANCIITLSVPQSKEKRNATGTRPVHSFAPKQGKIYLPVLDINKFNKYQPDIFDAERFIRFNSLIETGVHEFLHVLGLGHSEDPNDVMVSFPDQVRYDFVDSAESVPERNRLYLPGAKRYVIIFHSQDLATSPSIKLVRWLRWKAVRGELKELLEKAEQMPGVRKKQ